MDSGPGIEPAEYERVFEPFVRLAQPTQSLDSAATASPITSRSDSAAKSAAIEGTGLGLPIVKSVCEQAGIAVFLAPSPLGQDFAIEQNDQIANRGLCVTLVFSSDCNHEP